MKNAGSICLALALAIAGIASACTPTTEPVTPPTPTATPDASTAPTASATPTATTAPTASVTPTATVAPTASVTPTAPPAAVPAGPPVMASKMGEDLKKLGFDLAKLPPKLDKMPEAQKKKIMPLFVKALGFENCNGCHVEGDFKKKTRNTHMAVEMWEHFVVALRGEKGAANMFCDSCHQGKAKMLNRADSRGIQTFMKEQYEDKLERADKKEHSCGSCHSDPFEPKIFDKVWKVAKQ